MATTFPILGILSYILEGVKKAKNAWGHSEGKVKCYAFFLYCVTYMLRYWMGSKFQQRFFYGTYGTKHVFGFLADHKEGISPEGAVN